MKKALVSLLLTLFLLPATAQNATDSVKATINQLFRAMKNSDAAMLKDCFADSAILQTIGPAGEVANENIADFAQHVAAMGKGDAHEQITFDWVKTDDGLATAWTPYRFFYKGVFSHCGVDSYQLVRQRGQWKIQYLIDTRRKQPCP